MRLLAKGFTIRIILVMTLDEAIKHAEEKACGNTECAEEHRQLVEWLRELRELREQMTIIHQACTAARAAINFAELGRRPLKSNVKTASDVYAAYKEELYRHYALYGDACVRLDQGVVGDPRDIRVIMEDLEDSSKIK